jgi:hypothetical protein
MSSPGGRGCGPAGALLSAENNDGSIHNNITVTTKCWKDLLSLLAWVNELFIHILLDNEPFSKQGAYVVISSRGINDETERYGRLVVLEFAGDVLPLSRQ